MQNANYVVDSRGMVHFVKSAEERIALARELRDAEQN